MLVLFRQVIINTKVGFTPAPAARGCALAPSHPSLFRLFRSWPIQPIFASAISSRTPRPHASSACELRLRCAENSPPRLRDFCKPTNTLTRCLLHPRSSINDQRDSKAAALRRRCAEYMSLILDVSGVKSLGVSHYTLFFPIHKHKHPPFPEQQTWDPALIARSSSTVAINLTASLNDADSGVRATARCVFCCHAAVAPAFLTALRPLLSQAYWKFAEIHPEAAAKYDISLLGILMSLTHSPPRHPPPPATTPSGS